MVRDVHSELQVFSIAVLLILYKTFAKKIFDIDRNGDPNSLVLLENSSGFGYCSNCSDLDPT